MRLDDKDMIIKDYAEDESWQRYDIGFPVCCAADIDILLKQSRRLFREFVALCTNKVQYRYVVAGLPCQDLMIAGYNKGLLGLTGSRSVIFHISLYIGCAACHPAFIA